MDALDEFCGSTFWNLQTVWDTTILSLSSCFQQTVLIAIPCTFLWLSAPIQIIWLCRRPIRRIPWTVLNISKLIIGILVILFIIANMCRNIYLYVMDHDVEAVDFYSPLTLCLSCIFVTCLMYVEKRRGMPPSGIVFIFWLLLSLVDAVIYCIIIMKTFYEKSTPEFNSSFVSRTICSWFDGLTVTGCRRTLQFDDIWALHESLTSEMTTPRFQKHWKMELMKKSRTNDTVSRRRHVFSKKPSLFKAICKTFGWEFLYTSFLDLIITGLMFVNPLVLELLIKFIQSDEPIWHGYLYGAIIFIASSLHSLLYTQHFHRSYSIAVKFRAALTSTIYAKALRLSNVARRTSTVGEIVNLMAVDVMYFVDLIEEMNAFWTAPLQIGIALYLLWGQLGPSVLAGIAVVVLVLPINVFFIHKYESMQVFQMQNKDQRVKLTNELLNGIKVLKMYAWELPFAAQVDKVRRKELALIKKLGLCFGAAAFIWRMLPVLVLLVTFATYVLVDSNNSLDATKAFVSLSLFQIVQIPMILIPEVIVYTLQARVSLNRMREFLINEELQPSSVMHESSKARRKTSEAG